MLAVAAPLGAQTGSQTGPAQPSDQTPAAQQAPAGQTGQQTSPQQNPGQQNPGQQNPGQQAPGQVPPSGDQNPGVPGQENPAQDQSAEQNADQNMGGNQIPLILDMGGGSLDFSQDVSRRNFLGLGMGVGATYDSNLLSTVAPSLGGFIYSFLPNVNLQITRKRLTWGLDYSGGYIVDQKIKGANQELHNVAFDLKYRLSPHVTLSLDDHFSRVPQLVNQLPGASTISGGGAVQQPNQSVIIGSLAVQTQNAATAQLTYQYSASDVVGVGASNFIARYGKSPAGSPQSTLFNTNSYEGNGFYNHRLTPRNWLGLTYSYQRFSFTPVQETVNGDSILGLYTFYLKPSMQLGFFAGPEYSDLNTILVTTVVTPPTVTVTSTPTSSRHWSFSGGGSFGWQGKRTSANASVYRKISDGGGLLGAVELVAASGGVRRQILRTATLEFNAIYGTSSSLEQASGDFIKLNSVTGNLLWTQKLTRGFAVSAGYTQQYQKQTTQTPPAQTVNHSRGWVTLSYEFDKPLGR